MKTYLSPLTALVLAIGLAACDAPQTNVVAPQADAPQTNVVAPAVDASTPATATVATGTARTPAATPQTAPRPVLPTVAAEEPTITDYTSPAVSGLVAVRPYPRYNDVCQLLSESDVTAGLHVPGNDLIGCPKHEKGAIEDREADGARVVGNSLHWVLLTIPIEARV